MAVAEARPLLPEAVAKRRRRARSRGASIGLHVMLVAAAAIAIFPVIWIVLASFKSYNEIVGSTKLHVTPKTWTTANYRHVLTANDHIFLTWLWNSVLIAILTTIVGVFLAATAGYAL